MRKTDRKIENVLIKALTRACEIAQDRFEGFRWLTHFANYQRFPASLAVVCIYDTNARLAKTDREEMRALVKVELASVGIHLGDVRRQVRFDTEENCNEENNGKWSERFRTGPGADRDISGAGRGA